MAVWAVPGARRSEIIGEVEGFLRIRLAAPASEGRANQELCRFLADRLGAPLRSVRVRSGTTARRKVVILQDTTVEDVVRALAP